MGWLLKQSPGCVSDTVLEGMHDVGVGLVHQTPDIPKGITPAQLYHVVQVHHDGRHFWCFGRVQPNGQRQLVTGAHGEYEQVEHEWTMHSSKFLGHFRVYAKVV